MFLDPDQLIVALLVLIPGFVSTLVERDLQPVRFASDFEWTIVSLWRSILLNVVFLVLVAKGDQSFEQLAKDFKEAPTTGLAAYFLMLYGLAWLYGFVRGSAPRLRPTEIANRLGWTNLGSHDSVWERMRAKQRPVGHRTWIKIGDSAALGRVVHYSARIDRDKPIEFFMSPVYELRNGRWIEPSIGSERANGRYVRLQPEDRVEVYFRPDHWSPVQATDDAHVPTVPAT